MITIIMIKKAILIKITFIYLRWRGAARQKKRRQGHDRRQ